MNYKDIPGEFINDLQGILYSALPDTDRNVIDDIKAEANEALYKILEKYKLIEE